MPRAPRSKNKRPRAVHSCDFCRRVKARCNRSRPCDVCLARGHECEWTDSDQRFNHRNALLSTAPISESSTSGPCDTVHQPLLSTTSSRSASPISPHGIMAPVVPAILTSFPPPLPPAPQPTATRTELELSILRLLVHALQTRLNLPDSAMQDLRQMIVTGLPVGPVAATNWCDPCDPVRHANLQGYGTARLPPFPGAPFAFASPSSALASSAMPTMPAIAAVPAMPAITTWATSTSNPTVVPRPAQHVSPTPSPTMVDDSSGSESSLCTPLPSPSVAIPSMAPSSSTIIAPWPPSMGVTLTPDYAEAAEPWFKEDTTWPPMAPDELATWAAAHLTNGPTMMTAVAETNMDWRLEWLKRD